MGERIRVALVDDHPLFRSGLQVLLGRHGEFEVVGEAGSASEALELVARTSPDLAIVDVTLPDLGGASVTRELRRRRACNVLALSMVEHPERVAEVLQAGASGYALKSQSGEEILDAVRVVTEGGRYLAPRLAQRAEDDLFEGGEPKLLDALTPREREIFGLLVRGHSNESIAALLFIALRTVETHRHHLMKKLGAHSIVELVRLAARHQLLED